MVFDFGNMSKAMDALTRLDAVLSEMLACLLRIETLLTPPTDVADSIGAGKTEHGRFLAARDVTPYKHPYSDPERVAQTTPEVQP